MKNLLFRASKSIVFPTALAFIFLTACDKKNEAPVERHRAPELTPTNIPASYVGSAACGKCHDESIKATSGSRHDGSLSEVTAQTLALFHGQTAQAITGEPGAKLKAAFIRQDAKAKVVIDEVLEANFMIGKSPLMQPLLRGERGKLLVPPFAYDTRQTWEGGQRWFHLEGGENAGDFRAFGESYNTRCASCHSPNVQKAYDLDSDSFKTTRDETSVSCEACHGPGSVHVALAEKYQEAWPEADATKGLPSALALHEDRLWFRAKSSATAKLTVAVQQGSKKADELSSCGPCHSASIDWGPEPSDREFADRYRPAFLEEESHYPDGQAKKDLYAWGDFFQSKMQHAGVVCSDCHDPHSTVLRKPKETLCFSCHSEEKFNTPEHHVHQTTIDSSPLCVDCHMPAQKRMGVDVRHDHRFSIPRPDLTQSNGASDACESCHAGKSNAWAAQALAKIHGAPPAASPTLAFHALSKRTPGTALLLAEVVEQEQLPAWTRASALIAWSTLDESFLGESFDRQVEKSSEHSSPFLREAAARTMARVSPVVRPRLAHRLCDDPLRSVRIACALSLIDHPGIDSPKESFQKEPLKRALNEAKSGAIYNADTREGLLLLANIELAQGDHSRALTLFEMASQRFPRAADVPEQWAQALLRLGREEEAVALTEGALKAGLTTPWLLGEKSARLIKAEKFRLALPLLKQAFDSAPPHLRRKVGYSYAITVNELGDWAEALAILQLLKKELPAVKQISDAIAVIEAAR